MQGRVSRRSFLRYTTATGAVAAAAGTAAPAAAAPAGTVHDVPPFRFEEATIAELQAAMAAGSLTSRQLTSAYLRRIRQIDLSGIQLNSVIEVNPDALEIAAELDRERRHGRVRGPLHGIPILVKDNYATRDRMETTAGSLALLGSRVPRDAFVIRRLRRAGAVILGKLNLSEWANFRSLQSSSGWSARAGQCLSPYVLDHNPCGSSSGSGTAVAANLAAASLGTETDGSIVCPSSHNALVGIKPTLGLTSRSGVVPIAHSQDVTGPMARTVADAATVLGPMTGVDPRDPATADSRGHAFGDYRRFLDPDGLRGARIGVWREGVFGVSPEADAIADAAIGELSRLGATVVDPADIPNVADVFGPELTVLLFEFKADIAAYLSELERTSMRTLADLIAFNDANAEQELRWFGQEIFLLAEATTGLDDPAYLEALATSKRLAQEGIDGTLDRFDLDAIVSLTNSPPWTTDLVNGDHFLTASSTPAAVAGYPNITVPAGFSFGELPVGINFIGRRWGEPTLIRLAHGFEQGTRVRHAPRFLPSWASGTSSPGTRAPERAAPARPRPPRAPRAPGPAPSPPGGSSPAGCSRRLVAGADGGDLGDHRVALVVGGVEVGAEAQPGTRPVVTGVTAPDQLRGGLLEALQQPRDLPLRLGPDRLHAGVGDDPVALRRHHVRGDVGGAGHEAAGARRVRDRARPEGERRLVPEPAEHPRRQARRHLRLGVQVAGARPAEQPLDRAADHQVDVEGAHVQRDGPGRLVGVQQHQGADLVGAGDHRGRVQQRRGAERHVGDGDQRGLLVDRLQQPVQVDGEVAGGDGVDLGADRLLRPVQVVAGGELEVGGDQPAAWPRPVQAGQHLPGQHRHVGAERDRAGGGAEQPFQDRRDRPEPLQPAVPGDHPLGRPLLGEARERRRDRVRHRPQGVGGEVGATPQGGEAVTVGEQLVRHAWLLRPAAPAHPSYVRPAAAVGSLRLV